MTHHNDGQDESRNTPRPRGAPDAAAIIRAAADGEQEIFLHPAAPEPAAVEFERQLRMAVGRVMHDAATPPPDLRDRTLAAIATRLGQEPAGAHRSMLGARRIRSLVKPQHLSRLYRAAVAAGLLGFGVVLGASFRISPARAGDIEAALPMGQDVTRTLHAAFTRAKLTPDSARTTHAASMDLATSILGSVPRMPEPSATDVRFVGSSTATANETDFQAHFAVFTDFGTNPSDRDEVLMVVRKASRAEQEVLSDDRLYTILGTNLVLHAYRENDLMYYFAADAKRALIRVEQLMSIDTHGTNTDRGSVAINLTDLSARLGSSK